MIAVMIIMIACVFYVLNSWFKINHVIVKSNSSDVTAQQINELISKKLFGTFFTFNIDKIQQQFSTLSWVRNVYVTREFPDKIIIDIVQYQPIINLGNGKLLSSEDLIFNGYDKSGKLPLFNVPSNQLKNALKIYEQLKSFMQAKQLTLKSFTFHVGLMKFIFTNNMSIVMCGNNIDNQLSILNKYWTQVEQFESGVSSFNMCYQNAFTISKQ